MYIYCIAIRAPMHGTFQQLWCSYKLAFFLQSYNYLDNYTMNCIENYMVFKLKCCMMQWNLFNFYHFNSEKLTLKLFKWLLPTLSVYMVLYLQDISGYQQNQYSVS